MRAGFETYLRCGVPRSTASLRVGLRALSCRRLVAYSCKKRGLCPSCARRMAESARHLVDEVFGPRPVRQWVLSFPYPLRFLFASKPEAIGPVLGIVHRVIAGWLADQAGVPRDTAQCGVVTLIQRFGSALNSTSTSTCCGSTACTRTPPSVRSASRACTAPVRPHRRN